MSNVKIGDVIVIDENLLFRVIEIGNKQQDKYPYGLMDMKRFTIEVWSENLDFKVGDSIFGDELAIDAIITKETFETLKKL